MERIRFWFYVFKLYAVLAIRKITSKFWHFEDDYRWMDRNYSYPDYADKKLMTPGETQELLMQLIENKTPFAAARSGMTEMYASLFAYGARHGYIKKMPKRFMDKLYYWCGFFPNEQEAFCRYSEIHEQSLSDADILGLCRRTPEEFFLRKMPEDKKYTYIYFYDPFYYKPVWTQALKGKKVLIVHPFDQTIRQQYQKRELLFEDQALLPEFELITFKAVQTIAGNKDPRFETWFDALEYMKEEIKKIDFDVALLGCGAYGLPLSVEIKKMGRQAIYLGGSLQLLFGIKGARWESHPVISKLFNPYWVYPNAEDIPKNAEKVEGGCYW